jgi:hypothetical protein
MSDIFLGHMCEYCSEIRHYILVLVAIYLEKSVQSWARIIIPLVKDAAECNRVEILRGVNVESMTRGDPQITRPRDRHMGPCVCVSVRS